MPTSREFLILTSARVTNYGCFCDTGDVPIDEITALVAENEYGKSTFLRALAWWDSADIPFDEEDRWDGSPGGILDLVALTFRIPKGISAEITKAGFDTPPDEIRIIRDTNGTYRIENASSGDVLDPTDSEPEDDAYLEARNELLQLLEPYRVHEEVTVVVDAVQSHSEGTPLSPNLETYISTELSKLFSNEVLETVRKLFERFASAAEGSLTRTKPLFDGIDSYLPKLIYFDDAIEFIDDSVTYAEAESDHQKFQTMINLAKLANIDLLHVSEKAGHPRLLAGNTGQATLSNEISKYWYGAEVKFLIQLDATEMILTIEHRGRRQRPSRRSSGLKWFIGFFVNFMANTDEDLNGAVLLLDEPGLRLHVAQQPKLLELFQRLAADGNRIIYSTHLSQMLMPDRPRSYRLFVKDDKHPEAAIVVPDITKLSTKSDVLQPVRQALGMGIANAIGLGGSNLITEGWTDRLVVLTMSSFCDSQNLTHLRTPLISVLPAGGSGSKMMPLASMALAESTKVVLLVDNDKAGDSTQKILDKVYPGLIPLVRTHNGPNEKNLELEDLFERSFYLQLVNDSHHAVAGYSAISLSDLDNTLPICDAMKKRFKEIGLGDFQKMLPAIELQGRLERNLIPDASHLDKFANLFTRINAAFDEMIL